MNKPQLRKLNEAWYVDDDAVGAMRRGTRVVKVETEPRDLNPLGTRGTVLGSISVGGGRVGYFVEWETTRGLPVFVASFKIAAIGEIMR